jgi:hypothetical protein
VIGLTVGSRGYLEVHHVVVGGVDESKVRASARVHE